VVYTTGYFGSIGDGSYAYHVRNSGLFKTEFDGTPVSQTDIWINGYNNNSWQSNPRVAGLLNTDADRLYIVTGENRMNTDGSSQYFFIRLFPVSKP